MTDKTLGAYKRTTPDPDETTGEALARLQAEMTRLLDEADAELRGEADGGVAAALIEKEADQLADTPRPLTPDTITDEMVERAADRFRELDLDHEISEMDLVRGTIIAALIEPSARPEGAEEIDEPLRQANAAALGGALTPEQRRALADHLAAMRVRVVGEERS